MPVIRSEASAEDLIDAVAQLSNDELTRFMERVAKLRAERVAPHVSRDEAALLRGIARGLPIAQRRRYAELVGKRDGEQLSDDEHAELLRLSDELERLDAERAEAIVTLARLRRVSPHIVIESLGIPSVGDGR